MTWPNRIRNWGTEKEPLTSLRNFVVVVVYNSIRDSFLTCSSEEDQNCQEYGTSALTSVFIRYNDEYECVPSGGSNGHIPEIRKFGMKVKTASCVNRREFLYRCLNEQVVQDQRSAQAE